MKKKLRRIVVNGQIYLWKFTPGYVATQNPDDPSRCQDHFTAYLLQAKASPLRISFLTWEDPIIGGPLRAALPLDLDEMHSEAWSANLHTPNGAVWIIQKALGSGWQPEHSKSPFVIEDGVQWLMQMRDDDRLP